MSDRDDQELTDRLRMQALLRETAYHHPEIKVERQPINAKDSIELQQLLKGHVQIKVQEIKRNEEQLMKKVADYDEFYSQHFNMNIKNEMEDSLICQDIRDMHNMADLLLHPPTFEDELYLYRKATPSYLEQQELDAIFVSYEKAFQANEQVDDGAAEEAIRRAKHFLLREHDV